MFAFFQPDCLHYVFSVFHDIIMILFIYHLSSIFDTGLILQTQFWLWLWQPGQGTSLLQASVYISLSHVLGVISDLSSI